MSLLPGYLRGAALAAALALAAGGAAAQSVGDTVKASGGKAGTGKDDPVVAKINTIEIRRSDVIQALSAMPAQVQQLPMAQVYPLILERMIDGKLVASAGRTQKLQDDAEIKRKVADYEDRAVQEAYLDRSLKARVTDDMLKKKYDAFIKENPAQEEVRARHILVATEKAAQEALADLKKGTDFATVARAKSTDGSARDGGDLGYFNRGDMVGEFSDAAFAMKPGEVSKAPVKSQFGYHLIKVEDRRLAPAPSFEETKDQLRTELSQEMLAELVEELRIKAKVERFDLDGKPLPK
jgi:peptidyl-prolyl cis-trans isomerase C